MVEPTRIGWTAGTNAGAATVTLSNPSGAQPGDRIIALISHTGMGATITNLQGWTLLSLLTFNTRRWHILQRDYAFSYPALSLSTAEGMLWATVAIRAADGYELDATILGATWRRVDNGGSINTTQAPSVTSDGDTLALAFFTETSTAAEVEAGATLTGAGWGKWFWSKAATGDANPINYLAYRPMDAAGATGTPVVTYKSSTDDPISSQNGAGVQLLVPQTSTSPPNMDRTANGPLALTGAASRATDTTRAAAEQLVLDGSATQSSGISRQAVGTLVFDGQADRGIDTDRTASSLLVLSGAADRAVGIERKTTGSIEMSGTGDVEAGSVARTAVGILVLGGTVPHTVDVARNAAGTLVLAGAGMTGSQPSRLALTLTTHRLSHPVTGPRRLPPPIWPPA